MKDTKDVKMEQGAEGSMKKAAEEKTIPLTTAQVDKLNLLSAQSTAATARLNEYLGAILDAKGISGGWSVERLDKKILKLKKNEG